MASLLPVGGSGEGTFLEQRLTDRHSGRAIELEQQNGGSAFRCKAREDRPFPLKMGSAGFRVGSMGLRPRPRSLSHECLRQADGAPALDPAPLSRRSIRLPSGQPLIFSGFSWALCRYRACRVKHAAGPPCRRRQSAQLRGCGGGAPACRSSGFRSTCVSTQKADEPTLNRVASRNAIQRGLHRMVALTGPRCVMSLAHFGLAP